MPTVQLLAGSSERRRNLALVIQRLVERSRRYILVLLCSLHGMTNAGGVEDDTDRTESSLCLTTTPALHLHDVLCGCCHREF